MSFTFCTHHELAEHTAGEDHLQATRDYRKQLGLIRCQLVNYSERRIVTVSESLGSVRLRARDSVYEGPENSLRGKSDADAKIVERKVLLADGLVSDRKTPAKYVPGLLTVS